MTEWNYEKIKQLFAEKLHNNEDVIVGEFFVCKQKLTVVYIKSMVDADLLSKAIISPITEIRTQETLNCEILKNKYLTNPSNLIEKKFDDALLKVVNFWVVIFFENSKDFLCVDISKYPTRSPSEPPTSPVLQGPREGFVEDISTNISLLRKRLRSSSFAIDQLVVGKHTNTKVQICYLSDVADKKIVQRIIDKIKKIDIDGIIDSNYLVEFLEPKPFSIFKQIGKCEKPDIVCAKLLEGRIAIIVDGSPIVLTLPYIYIEDMQSSNDYYGKYGYATYMRFIRFIGIIMSVIIPGVYLSIRLYHYKILPLKLLITISNSTQNLPMTPFLELLFILLLFDILYEVSLRLPRYLGLATSIVGALILGDTGVKAGLISPPGVMIIALSLISIYTVPDQVYQLSILRVLFLFIGGTLGLFGIVAGVIFFICHLSTFDAYGGAYLAPISPYIKNDKKDSLVRLPFPKMKTRPQSFSNKNKVRQK